MGTLNNNFEKQNQLASYFGKSYGEFLYSGTLAIETALISSGVKRGDFILIPNNVCYRILLSVVRTGAIPIIVNPGNGYILTPNEIFQVFKKYNIHSIILVHNLGLPVDITSIKKLSPSKVNIIEDASQAWGIISSGNSLGKFSDYVVTSFGTSKPLSFGIGGAIFSDNQMFRSHLDNYDKYSRLNKNITLPYILPGFIDFSVNSLVNIGNKNVNKQRIIANFFIKELVKTNLSFYMPLEGDHPSWHRFPIWTKDKKLFQYVRKTADMCGIKYELPHKINLNNCPLALENNSIYIDYQTQKYHHLLVKTRQNLLFNIKKWTKKIKSK